MPRPLALPVLPRVIGHRGAAAHAPENTLASLRKAAALGASWVEFDVRLTRDGGLVVIHDETVDRTTGGRGRVLDLSVADLRELDAGAWFGAAFVGQRVPSLEDAIAVLEQLGLGANVEIKTSAREAKDTATALARILAAQWPQSLPAPLISSFEVAALAAMQELAPRWPRGLLLKRLEGDWLGLLDRLEAATLNLDHKPLDRAALARAQRSGRPVLLYTVNDARRARDLLEWGAAAVFTDRPEMAAELP
jgi:glycerophosphoryl diester phosphodiesterase